MRNFPGKQTGASAIVTIIVLAILGYGVYLGIQYVPQAIEAKSIDSILDTVETDHRMDPLGSEYEVKEKVIKLMQINEMNEMTKNVSVKKMGGKTTVKVAYDRELNLVYKTQPMHYEKVLVLR